MMQFCKECTVLAHHRLVFAVDHERNQGAIRFSKVLLYKFLLARGYKVAYQVEYAAPGQRQKKP